MSKKMRRSGKKAGNFSSKIKETTCERITPEKTKKKSDFTGPKSLFEFDFLSASTAESTPSFKFKKFSSPVKVKFNSEKEKSFLDSDSQEEKEDFNSKKKKLRNDSERKTFKLAANDFTINYKPLPDPERVQERIVSKKKNINKSFIDFGGLKIQSSKGRTAVFAGAARTTYTHVYRLEQLCLRVLMDNIDRITYVGDAPYYLLKSVLERCDPKQLARIERINSHLEEDTDELWQALCDKEFRGRNPDDEDLDSWKELYDHCINERERRLKAITKNINKKKEAAGPVRTTKLAFTNNVAKPPRDVAKKQEKFGTGSGNPVIVTRNLSAGPSGRPVPDKPKIAPLMKKALMIQKNRFRR